VRTPQGAFCMMATNVATGLEIEREDHSAGQAVILMSDKAGDAAFVDIRSIGGLSDDVNRKLSQQVCQLLHDSLGVPSDRVYLNFTDVGAGNWGWNGSTFG
jgi:phenylpyruvate tautomerase